MRASVVALLLAPLSSLGGFGFTLHAHVPLDHAARAHGRHYMMGMSEPIPPSADSCSLPQWPTPEMQPVDVVRAQLYAMQEGNAQRFWRFVSPEGKRDTGRTIRARYPYIRPPLYSEMPTYAPLVHCRDFEMLSAVRIGVTGAMQKPTYQVRARVWPALAHGERECGGGSITPAPIFYIFRLTLQPKERPVCYEDDPMQAGISTGPPFAGCWQTDKVVQDERRDDGDQGDEPPDGDGGGGEQLRARLAAILRREQSSVLA